MKKTIISVSILFFAFFTALGQSVTLEPTQTNQLSVQAFSAQRPTFSGFHSTGTTLPRTATLSGRMLVGLQGYGYTGSAFNTNPNASIEMRATQDFSAFQQGTDISFFTTSNGSTTPFERMRISNNGNLGIGTSIPNGNLSFSNTNNNRKILLYEDANNDHQFMGFGVNSQTLRYQIPSLNNNHVFYAGTSTTNSNELMRITGTGRVGIGTATPQTMLEVRTPSNFFGIQHTDGTVNIATYISPSDGGWIGTRSNHSFSLFTNDGSAAINIGTDKRVAINGVKNSTGTLQVYQIGGNGITLFNGDNTHRWEMAVNFFNTTDGGGDFGFFANGTIKAEIDRITGVYVLGSDRRLKKNIAPLENVLDKVMQLKPSTYQYKADNPNGVMSTGLIAQEVEPIFPQFVFNKKDKEGKDLKMMDYSSMSIIALKAIQEQQAMIEKLQNENSSLKTDNQAFESRLATIENLVSRIGESKKTVGEK